jgi:membrane-associated phospholipid phosphatase
LKRRRALALAGVGAALFAVSTHLATDDRTQAVESRIFHAVNGLPSWLYPVLWGPMQLGNLVVGAVIALAVALIGRRPKVAVAVVAAVALKLVVERVVRKELADEFLQHRQRPGTLQTGAVLRGDVPAEGPSFPSGHVILVAGLAAVLTPLLPRRWADLPWALVGLVAFGRVYVGAHNPLDVVAGFGLGLSVGSALDVALGDANVHWSRQSAPRVRAYLARRAEHAG